MTNEANEMSAASRGSRGDTLSVLRTLIDGVRGMGLGDPDSGDRVEASDVVRWAVDEIEQQRGSLQWLHGLLTEAEERLARLRLTDEERAAVDDGIDSVSGDESLSPSQRREIATSLRGLLRRLG
jgi:Arc/MetJ-type ribon-helix-helix transcriptional regulator